MTESTAPPWAGDAGQHKDAETTSAPAPMMFTDSAVTSTLSGQPVLSGAVAGTAGYGVPAGTKSPWQRGTYWRYVGMASGLQLILAALLLSTTLSLLDTDDVYSYEAVEVEVVNGQGDVRLNPDGDLRLAYLSRSYTSADYDSDYWYHNGMWLDYGDSISYDYGYYGGAAYDQSWDEETPRTVMMNYMPVDFNALVVEADNDWDNRSMFIATDLWLNHSNTTSTLHDYTTWSLNANDLTPVAVDGGWTVNYSASNFDRACDIAYFEFLVPHPDLEDDERIRLVLSMRNCWASNPTAMSTDFEIQPYRYGVEVGGWSPDNSTLWFDHEQLGNTTLMLQMEFENMDAWEKDERRRAAQGTMLTIAPIASLLGLPILAIVGGARKGRSAAWGSITGFLLMPGSLIFWLWASFATW